MSCETIFFLEDGSRSYFTICQNFSLSTSRSWSSSRNDLLDFKGEYPMDPTKWSADQIHDYLSKVDKEIADVFRKENLDGESLMFGNTEDLKELYAPFPVGRRMRFEARVARLRNHQSQVRYADNESEKHQFHISIGKSSLSGALMHYHASGLSCPSVTIATFHTGARANNNNHGWGQQPKTVGRIPEKVPRYTVLSAIVCRDCTFNSYNESISPGHTSVSFSMVCNPRKTVIHHRALYDFQHVGQKAMLETLMSSMTPEAALDLEKRWEKLIEEDPLSVVEVCTMSYNKTIKDWEKWLLGPHMRWRKEVHKFYPHDFRLACFEFVKIWRTDKNILKRKLPSDVLTVIFGFLASMYNLKAPIDNIKYPKAWLANGDAAAAAGEGEGEEDF